MSTQSSNIGLTIPAVGSDAGPAFAQEINADLVQLDSVLGGTNSLDVSGNSNITLTKTQAQNLNQVFVGNLTGDVTIFFPAAPSSGGAFGIQNLAQGNFKLRVGVVGGNNTQVIPSGIPLWVWMDSFLFTWTSASPVAPTTGTYWKVISDTTINAQSAVILQLPPPPFIRFRVTLQGATVPTPGALQGLALQASNNGAASFFPTNYNWLQYLIFGQTLNTNFSAANAAGSIQLWSPGTVQGGGNNQSAYVDMVFELWPNQSVTQSGAFCLQGSTSFTLLGYSFGRTDFSGFGLAAPVNAIKIFPNSGTFSGELILEGLN